MVTIHSAGRNHLQFVELFPDSTSILLRFTFRKNMLTAAFLQQAKLKLKVPIFIEDSVLDVTVKWYRPLLELVCTQLASILSLSNDVTRMMEMELERLSKQKPFLERIEFKVDEVHHWMKQVTTNKIKWIPLTCLRVSSIVLEHVNDFTTLTLWFDRLQDTEQFLFGLEHESEAAELQVAIVLESRTRNYIDALANNVVKALAQPEQLFHSLKSELEKIFFSVRKE